MKAVATCLSILGLVGALVLNGTSGAMAQPLSLDERLVDLQERHDDGETLPLEELCDAYTAVLTAGFAQSEALDGLTARTFLSNLLAQQGRSGGFQSLLRDCGF